jgi:hypothetical protein
MESQNRALLGLSRSSHVVDARRSVVTPPNMINLLRRTFPVTSNPLYVVWFCVENVTRLSVATPTLAGFNVNSEIGCAESGSLESEGAVME